MLVLVPMLPEATLMLPGTTLMLLWCYSRQRANGKKKLPGGLFGTKFIRRRLQRNGNFHNFQKVAIILQSGDGSEIERRLQRNSNF